jgi:hypothetical protein
LESTEKEQLKSERKARNQEVAKNILKKMGGRGKTAEDK